MRAALLMLITALAAFPLLSRAAPADIPARADEAIRPYHVHVPDADLTDLHRRIANTRWPDKETVADDSQGIPLAKVKALVEYWGKGYDWRKFEARMNQLPQFVTTIDGEEIYFIHVRSKNPKALPLILTHGWPGSPIEFLKTIDPLVNPTAYGGKAEDAFDVVIPAIPGYGFSSKPKGMGWGPERVAKAWDTLMHRLGYARYVSQGGDHGSVISDALARQSPAGLLGIHLNMPAAIPAELVKPIFGGDPSPAGLPADEKRAFDSLSMFFSRNAAYGAMMVTRPQTISYPLADSPAGEAAWMYEKFVQWSDNRGHAEGVLDRDEMLDDISLYWLTNTSASASRFYWENNNNNFSADAQKTHDIKVPVAITVFPYEIYQTPKRWAERAYPSLYYFHAVDKGGHFAAWEQPQLFVEELRAAFRPLR
ncbi:MAG TPA: epoxide hydrolase [Steroidobacteraceae bacterium]|jgi:pimeloyl-ACP methyl ester carboxylesterase